MTSVDSQDWVDDASSFDEAMMRFEALDPQPTVGPDLPGNAVIVRRTTRTYTTALITTADPNVVMASVNVSRPAAFSA